MKMIWKKNESGIDKSRLSYLVGHLYDENMLKSLIGITTSSYDFTSLTPEIKNFCSTKSNFKYT